MPNDTDTPEKPQTASSRSPSTPCSVEFYFEGLCGWGDITYWRVIERRSDEETARRDEADYRSWINEGEWRDFRIVKVNTTREILSQND